MLALAQKNTKNNSEKTENTHTLSMEEATTFLKKIGEWDSVSKFDRQIILDWANYLKKRGVSK